MNKTRKSTAIVKINIENTLLMLLSEHPYTNININDICEMANVGRTSFYRHYNDKDDVLASIFKRFYVSFLEKQKISEPESFNKVNIPTLIEYIESVRKYINILFDNNLDYILLKSFKTLITKIEGLDTSYKITFFINGLFGVIKYWKDNDYKLSSKEISNIVISFLD